LRTLLTILICLISFLTAWAQEKEKTVQLVNAQSVKDLSTFSDSIPKVKQRGALDSLELRKSRLLKKVTRKTSSVSPAHLDTVHVETTTPRIALPEMAQPEIPSPSLDSISLPKTAELQKRIDNKLDSGMNKVGEQLGIDQTKLTDQFNIDGKVPLHDKLPLPDTQAPGDLKFPNGVLPGDVPTTMDLPQTDLSKIEPPATDLPSVPDMKIGGQLKGAQLQDKASSVTDKLDAVQQEGEKSKSALGKIDGVQQQVKEVQDGGVDGAMQNAEKKAENIGPVNDVKRKVAPATAKQAEYEAMIKKYQNKKLAQQELQRKLGNVVNDQVNQFTPSVNRTIVDLEKSKKRWNGAKQVGDSIRHKKINLMAGRPVGRRLVPGVTFQVLRQTVYSMDLGAQLGYRLTSNFTAGVGGSYRIGVSKKFEQYVQGLDVTGGRVYADLAFRKGWFPHAELEYVKAKVYDDDLERYDDAQIVQTNIGLGKSYKLSKRLNGYALLLYRFEWRGELPDRSKLNLRVGFNFDTKKRRTKVINDVKIKL
jgi:hypothetical protein